MQQFDTETHRQLTCESFSASVAYGRLVLGMLFAMNAIVYVIEAGASGLGGMFLAALAPGLAYGSQCCFTCGGNKHGLALMAGSVITAIASGISAVTA